MFPPTCRWWPVIGIFFFALPIVLGHLGFGCTKTDPDIPTNPDVPAETQTDVQVLAAPESSSPAIPTAAFAILPLAGGIAAAALGRWRDS